MPSIRKKNCKNDDNDSNDSLSLKRAYKLPMSIAENMRKKEIINILCSKVWLTKVNSENNRVPYGFVKNLVDESKFIYPWLTHGILNREFSIYISNKDKYSPSEKYIVKLQ